MSRGTWVRTPGRSPGFAYRTVTFYGEPFQVSSATQRLSHSPTALQHRPDTPRYPLRTTLAGLHAQGLGSSRFARRYWGNRFCFLFLRVLRWFTSPGSPLAPYFTQKRISQHYSGSCCKIRISPDHSLFAALRGFSQLTTSFLAFLRQGIHRMPLVA